jgi:hypothetical protein
MSNPIAGAPCNDGVGMKGKPKKAKRSTTPHRIMIIQAATLRRLGEHPRTDRKSR